MYAVESDNRSVATHKEASAIRITREEQDIQKLMNCFTSGLMTNLPGGTPYNGLYGEAPPERGTFFRLQVFKGVGISQV